MSIFIPISIGVGCALAYLIVYGDRHFKKKEFVDDLEPKHPDPEPEIEEWESFDTINQKPWKEPKKP